MPEKPDRSGAFCAVTPPNARTGSVAWRAISRARGADKNAAPGWLSVAKTGESSAASAKGACNPRGEWAATVIIQ